jgi:hypothetical protein
MALTSSQITITKVYLAILNRVPDKAGLQFWSGLLDGGMSLNTIENFFAGSDEAKTLYPASLPTDAFVTEQYINIFNRVPDDAGLAFLTAAINNGLPRQLLQMAFMDAGLSGSDGPLSQAFATNRLSVAEHAVDRMLTQNYQIDPTTLQSILATVSADPATVTTANARIDGDNTGGLTPPTNALTVAAATNGINPTEKQAGVAVVVDLTGTHASAGNTVELLINGAAFPTAVTHVLTSSEITAHSATVTIPSTANWGGDGSKVLTARVKDTAGHVGADGGAVTVVLDTTAPNAPTNALSIPTAPSGISLAEKAAGVPVVVDLTGTSAVSGDTVSILIGGKAFTTPADHVLTDSEIASHSATVTIAANNAGWGADGSKVLTARVTDIAGNVGTPGGSLTVTLDTVAPNSPVVAIPATAGGINAAEKAAPITATVALPTSAAAGDTVNLYVNGATFTTPVTRVLTTSDITAKSVTLTIAANDTAWGADGSKTVTARITDRVGNVGTAGTGITFALDTTAPTVGASAVTIPAAVGGISASEKSVGVAVTIDLTGSGAVANDKLELLLGGVPFATPVIHALTTGEATALSTTVVIPSTAGWGADGVKSISARLTDVAGNVGTASGATSVTLDTVAPGTPTVALTVPAATNNISATEKIAGVVVNANLTGTNAAAGDTLSVLLGGVAFTNPVNYVLTAADITANTASLVIPVNAGWGSDGSKTLTARVTDQAGNVGTAGGAVVVVMDTTAPNAPSTQLIVPAASNNIDAAEEAAGVAVTVGLAGTSAATGDTLEILLNGASFTVPVTHTVTAGDVATNSITLTIPNAAGWGADGSKTLTARFTDVAGNVGTAGGSITATLDTVSPGGVTNPLVVPAAGGGGINAAELSAGVTVNVDLTGTSAVAGDRVEILLGGASFPTPVVHSITSGDVASNTASFVIPSGAGWGADGNKTLTAQMSDSSGNPSAVGGSVTVSLDTQAPTAPTGVSLTPMGGTVIANALNSTNTQLIAQATIVAGEATGGSAQLKIGGITVATDNTILVGDTTVDFATATISNAQLQAAIAAGGVVTVTVLDASGNSSTSAVGNPTLLVDYNAPSAPTGVTLTPVGGTVVANALNTTNTELDAQAHIIAGQATGGFAQLKIGGFAVATDNTIAAGDTTVDFATATLNNAQLQAAISSGGVVSVVLYDAAGNPAVSSVANPTLTVDYTAPTAPTAVTLTPVGGTVVANTLNTTNTQLTAQATITAGDATGGSAILKIGGIAVATDSSIAGGDTTVTFATTTANNAQLQAAIASGGVATVTLIDAAGNATVSAAANPTLAVDYTPPTTAATPFTFVNNAGGATSYDATDVIKLFFSEAVAVASIGTPTLGGTGGNLDNSSIAAVGAAGGHATEFDITLANGTGSLSLSAGTTITLVGVDTAGNSANVTWTLT